MRNEDQTSLKDRSMPFLMVVSFSNRSVLQLAAYVRPCGRKVIRSRVVNYLSGWLNPMILWVAKSCTTLGGWNPINNCLHLPHINWRRISQPTGAISWPGEDHWIPSRHRWLFQYKHGPIVGWFGVPPATRKLPYENGISIQVWRWCIRPVPNWLVILNAIYF